MGVAPAHTLAVGDYKYDVMAGRDAGCRTVLVDLGARPTPTSCPTGARPTWSSSRCASSCHCSAIGSTARSARRGSGGSAAWARSAASRLGQRVRELPLGHDVGAALGARRVHDVGALVVDEADRAHGDGRRRHAASASSAAERASACAGRRSPASPRAPPRPSAAGSRVAWTVTPLVLRRLAHLRREQHVRDEIDDVSHADRGTVRSNGPEHPVGWLPLLHSWPGGVRRRSVARDRPLFCHRTRPRSSAARRHSRGH